MRHRKRRELRLRKYCAMAPAVLDNPFRALVHHAAEPGENFEFQELSVFETQSFRRLPHGRDLALTPDARHTLADVHGGLLALVEKPGLKHDLPVGDRDEIGGDIAREIAFLRGGDRKRGERTAAALLPEFSSTF